MTVIGIVIVGLVAAYVVEIVELGDPYGTMFNGLIATAVALCFGAELAWLLAVCRGRVHAWRHYFIFTVMLLALAVLLPEAGGMWVTKLKERQARHAEPLREFVLTRWFAGLPADTPCSSYRQHAVGGGHLDVVSIRIGGTIWSFKARQMNSGGWRFPEMDGRPAAIAYTAGAKAIAISSPAEAREYLSRIGVPTGQIGRGQLIQERPSNKFRFTGPACGGKYDVWHDGYAEFHLDQPVVVPEQ